MELPLFAATPMLRGFGAMGTAPLLVTFTLHSLLLKCSPIRGTTKSDLKIRCTFQSGV